MNIPPLIPHTLAKFVVIGFGFSFLATAAVVVSGYYAPNDWLYQLKPFAAPDRTRAGIAYQVLKVGLTATAILGGLWTAAYLSCWPYLYYLARKEQQTLRQEADARAFAAEVSRKAKEQADEDRRRRNLDKWERDKWEKEIFDTKLIEVERQVLRAYAQHAVTADFYGNATEEDRLRAFAAKLTGLGIPLVGLLRRSQHATLSKLAAYAPRLPTVEIHHIVPNPSLHAPRYNPANYPGISVNLSIYDEYYG